MPLGLNWLKQKPMNKDVTKELAEAAGYTNLVAGGTSMPKVSWRKTNQAYRLEVSVPGVDPRNFSIDIINRSLLVFHQFQQYEMLIPNLIHKVNIPFDVEVDGIRATRATKKLKINLPFNELAGGYQKHIDIEPEY